MLKTLYFPHVLFLSVLSTTLQVAAAIIIIIIFIATTTTTITISNLQMGTLRAREIGTLRHAQGHVDRKWQSQQFFPCISGCERESCQWINCSLLVLG